MLCTLYNTYVGKKEPFNTIGSTISLYICGITSYDYAHIGHARSAVAFDILIRYFLLCGKDVVFIRNFTDIDDKIIARATAEGVEYSTISEKYIAAYHEDMDKLGILRPSIEPYATQHIGDMIAFIEALIHKGFAYVTVNGNVYYRVERFAKYGALSGHTVDELFDGVRIENDKEKENPLDFALWKIAKEGEPFWSSPWGDGRPGWHIECSAMSTRYSALPLDIHGGGRDLIFPHHENEIAQTEALCDCTFARFWVHNGFVQNNAEKMSKSLANFVTVRDVYSKYLPEVLRYFLLTKQYRNPLDFSLESMNEAEKNLRSLYAQLASIEEYAKNNAIDTAHRVLFEEGSLRTDIHKQEGIYTERVDITNAVATEAIESPFVRAFLVHDTPALCAQYKEYRTGFFTALYDDMNTAAALGFLIPLIQHVAHSVTYSNAGTASLVSAFYADKYYYTHLLGVLEKQPHVAIAEYKMHALRRLQQMNPAITEEYILSAIAERIEARKDKDFKKADAIRDALNNEGILLQDTKEGTVWDVV